MKQLTLMGIISCFLKRAGFDLVFRNSLPNSNQATVATLATLTENFFTNLFNNNQLNTVVVENNEITENSQNEEPI